MHSRWDLNLNCISTLKGVRHLSQASAAAYNSLVFTDTLGGYSYKFTSTSITLSSVNTDTVAQTYSFSGVGNLCITSTSLSCSYGVPFTASGNTKSSSASDFQFTYSMVRRLDRRTVLLDLHAASSCLRV